MTLRRKSFYFLKKQKKKHQALLLRAFLWCASRTPIRTVRRWWPSPAKWGCTAGYDHSPFPVSSLPQSRLALQGNQKRRVPIHILYFFICSLSFLFLNKYYFCHYSAINFPKSSPEHYTVTPSSSGRSGWSAGRSPFEASLSAGSFSAASASSGPRWRAC